MAENFNDVTAAFDGWLQPLTAERRTGGYTDGRWVGNAPTPITFDGVVQNATPEDLKVLPEGNRADEAIKIHTITPLIAQKNTDTKGDVVLYDGKNWLVYNVADRKIGGYYKAIAVKKET